MTTPDPPTFVTASSRVWFLRTGADSGGEVHEQRVEYQPDSPFPPAHFHPAQDEHFEIESGEMVVIVEGDERTLSMGETIEIPSGMSHKMRNPSKTDPAVVRWETRPALRTAEFHETAAGLKGGIADRALFAHEFRDVFRLSGIQGVLVPLLARVALLRGKTAKD